MTQDAESVAEMIFERGVLVDLDIGKPTFQRKLRQNDLLMENINEDVLYLGHKKLLPKKALEELVTLEGKARSALTTRSLPFPLGGARFVRRETLSELISSLHGIKAEWNAKVLVLIQAYPEVKRQQLEQFEKQSQELAKAEMKKYENAAPALRAEKAEKFRLWLEQQKEETRSLYPDVDKLDTLFPFSWRMFKLNPVGMDETNADAHRQFMDAQNQLKTDLQQWVRRATVEMHRTLGEAAQNAANLLEKNGKLDPRNLRPLFNAFETFKSVDFTGASDFQNVVEQIKQRFGVRDLQGNVNYEQTSIAIQGSSGAFKDLLANVASLAEEKVAQEAGIKSVQRAGEFRRIIEI